MQLDLLQITFLAILQGITEYLPISSSGHLILPSLLWGWQDQGLVFDVAVHVGSLLAVIAYFWQQLLLLFQGWTSSIRQRRSNADSRLAWFLILASVPAGLAGLLLNDRVEEYARSLPVIAATSIIFGLLLWIADRRTTAQRGLDKLNWKTALFIGFAQMLALIPGTSRSGVTMTAALFSGMSRHAAAQFSFLLAIPIIAASGLIKGLEFYQIGASVSDWILLIYAIMVSGVVSYLCIHYFLKLIERIGFAPFVIYRVLLGVGLMLLYLR